MSRKKLAWAPDTVLGDRLMFEGFEPLKISVGQDSYFNKVDRNLAEDASNYTHRVLADGQTHYDHALEAIDAATNSGLSVQSIPNEEGETVQTPIDREVANPPRRSRPVADTFLEMENVLDETSLTIEEYAHSGGDLTETGDLNEVVSSADGMPLGVKGKAYNQNDEKVAQIGYWRDGTFGWIENPLYDGELGTETKAELDATVEQVTGRSVDEKL
jgi:hypothetical protein